MSVLASACSWPTTAGEDLLEGGFGVVNEQYATSPEPDRSYSALREATSLELYFINRRVVLFHRNDTYLSLADSTQTQLGRSAVRNINSQLHNGVRVGLGLGLVMTLPPDIDYVRSPAAGRKPTDRRSGLTFGYRLSRPLAAPGPACSPVPRGGPRRCGRGRVPRADPQAAVVALGVVGRVARIVGRVPRSGPGTDPAAALVGRRAGAAPAGRHRRPGCAQRTRRAVVVGGVPRSGLGRLRSRLGSAKRTPARPGDTRFRGPGLSCRRRAARKSSWRRAPRAGSRWAVLPGSNACVTLRFRRERE